MRLGISRETDCEINETKIYEISIFPHCYTRKGQGWLQFLIVTYFKLHVTTSVKYINRFQSCSHASYMYILVVNKADSSHKKSCYTRSVYSAGPLSRHKDMKQDYVGGLCCVSAPNSLAASDERMLVKKRPLTNVSSPLPRNNLWLFTSTFKPVSFLAFNQARIFISLQLHLNLLINNLRKV